MGTTAAPATTTTTTTTTTSTSCIPGSTFPQDCNVCVCDPLGVPVCTTNSCGTCWLSLAPLLALRVSSRSLTEGSPIRAVLSGSMGGSIRASTGAQPRLTQQAPM